MKIECTTIYFSSDHVPISYFFMGLYSQELFPFKCILCTAEAVVRQLVLSEQFSVQNTVFVKGLALACFNKKLK